MAKNLSQKSTNGEIFFVTNVTNNKRLKDHIFILDKPTSVYITKGSSLSVTKKIYAAKTKLVIVDRKLHDDNILKIPLAKCKIGSLLCFIPIKYIQKPIPKDGTRHEELVINAINNFILNVGAAINIKLKGDSHVYRDIVYAVKVNLALSAKHGYSSVYLPKADIILCKDNKNPVDVDSIYLSHKKDGSADATQQYGGVSIESGDNIYSNKNVKSFLKRAAMLLDDVHDRLRCNIIGKYNDDKLSNLSIFGNEYGRKFSLQHVQAICQGHPVFKKIAGDNCYELSFTTDISLSGDLDHFKGKYLPVLCARYSAGRSFTYNGVVYKNVRVGIFPYEKVGRSGNPVIIEL